MCLAVPGMDSQYPIPGQGKQEIPSGPTQVEVHSEKRQQFLHLTRSVEQPDNHGRTGMEKSKLNGDGEHCN